jgi:hypothetical protein
MKKLISCEDYVIGLKKVSAVTFCSKSIKYAKLLKQPTTLGMFVPVGEDGEVLSEPELIDVSNGFDHSDSMWDEKEVAQYQKALSRVLFKGFEVIGKNEIIVVVQNTQYKKGLNIHYIHFVDGKSKYDTLADLTSLGLELNN